MKKTVLGMIMGVMLGLGLVAVAPSPVMADPLNLCDDPSFTDEALREAAGCRKDDKVNDTIFPAVETMIQIVLGIVGIVGVVIIIYGGIMYTISTGDAAKLAKAKNIILYGIVGLVVSGLAYAIVAFVSQSIFG